MLIVRESPPETPMHELRRYVGLGEGDVELLRGLLPVARPHFPRIAREFYDTIREHEEAHAVFTGEEQIARLQRSLQRWMERVLSGRYDDAYYAESQKIGRMHVKVGLAQRYMFTAMALIRVGLVRIARELPEPTGTRTSEAVMRMLDIELAIMLEAYRDDYIARYQRIGRLEREELNRTLLRTEHRYVNAVELARALIVGVDKAGVVRLFNREAERITGFSRDEILGGPFDVLLQEDHVDTCGAALRAMARGERGLEAVECGLRTKSGKYRDVRWQLAYAPSEEDEEVVLFVIGQDMTEEHTRSEQQKQTEKLAAVGTLAAGLAHEIRNPLHGARLHVSFLDRALRKQNATPDMLEAVHVVSDEIQRLADLVTEFLDFARPKPPQRRQTSARALCDRAMQLLAHKAEAAHARLALDFPTRDPHLDVDPAKIEQVLLNLMGNSIEAISSGGGSTVTLRVRRQPRRVIFEIEDDGPGLPDQDAPIFDPFFSTKPSGTGLGLPIVHRIVTDHGGDVSVESGSGRTIFRVSLPLEPE